jgi:hypothetical protein
VWAPTPTSASVLLQAGRYNHHQHHEHRHHFAGGNPIPGSWSYNYTNNDVREVNFSPVAPLPPSSTIKVATSGLLDYAGNTFTPVTSTFTTAALPDYTQPTATLDFGSNTTGVGHQRVVHLPLLRAHGSGQRQCQSNTDVYS